MRPEPVCQSCADAESHTVLMYRNEPDRYFMLHIYGQTAFTVCEIYDIAAQNAIHSLALLVCSNIHRSDYAIVLV